MRVSTTRKVVQLTPATHVLLFNHRLMLLAMTLRARKRITMPMTLLQQTLVTLGMTFGFLVWLVLRRALTTW